MVPKMEYFGILLIALLALTIQNGLSEDEEDRIVGGSYAYNGQFPYQVSVQVNNRHICGGSIIANRTILTAAHCVYNISATDTYTILVGTSDLYSNRSATARRYNVTSLVPHENYTSSSFNYDIGVIILNETIAFNRNVREIVVDAAAVPGGERAVVSGWGFTSYPGVPSRYLKYLRVRTITNQQCSNAGIAAVGPGNLCTVNPFFQGNCFGDSGGPLARNGRQIGVVSFVVPCARNFPDGYTRLSYYAQWVQAHSV